MRENQQNTHVQEWRAPHLSCERCMGRRRTSYLTRCHVHEWQWGFGCHHGRGSGLCIQCSRVLVASFVSYSNVAIFALVAVRSTLMKSLTATSRLRPHSSSGFWLQIVIKNDAVLRSTEGRYLGGTNFRKKELKKKERGINEIRERGSEKMTRICKKLSERKQD